MFMHLWGPDHRFTQSFSLKVSLIHSPIHAFNRCTGIILLPALLQKLVGDFFNFSQGNLENLVGNLEGILRDFF